MPIPLIELRKRADQSQDQLGRLAGVSGKTIREIERGMARGPHAATMRRIADALGVTPGDIEEFARFYPVPPAPVEEARPLREVRYRACVGMNELAGLTGIPSATIQRIETHKAAPPPGSIELIAEALGVAPTDIAEFVMRDQVLGR